MNTSTPGSPLIEPLAILSFDVEEHCRIEAASGLSFTAAQRDYSAGRVLPVMHWILEELARYEQRATFFVVGQLARQQPDLVRAIHRAGHEVASHGWDHQRLHNLTLAQFRDDVQKSKDLLEQLIGEPVAGYRAPTFSLVRKTAWALDELARLGVRYDSSIYPVRHDRYGIPDAPRDPFRAAGERYDILELPPARLDLLGLRLPMGGGGYFRLFPLFFIEWALRQAQRLGRPPVAMLYFHPWEFDPDQERLPLRRISRFRTYVGIRRSRARLTTLLQRHRFVRAIDAVRQLEPLREQLPRFPLCPASLLPFPVPAQPEPHAQPAGIA